MKLKIEYFALFRQWRGQSAEVLESVAETTGQLYDELREKYGFAMDKDHVRVALNGAFSTWKAALKEGDMVVFIPPVAGG